MSPVAPQILLINWALKLVVIGVRQSVLASQRIVRAPSATIYAMLFELLRSLRDPWGAKN
jgi:hypothetical protein